MHSTPHPELNLPQKGKHGKLILTLIALVVFGPMLFAWVLYTKGNVHQLKLSHNGDLISPTQNMTSTVFYDMKENTFFQGETLRGKWWLMYVGPNKCYQECEDILYNLRQIRTALGKNMTRVDRLFIPHPHCSVNICERYLNEFYPEMRRASMKPADFEHLFGSISNPIDRAMLGEIYLIDPKGQMMMRYPADTPPNDILSDLKRLLRVSKIG